ncbi:hypothetical protein HALLA_07750 [Halostagnicola larsenii XH-48]|uniref:Halobacterial output domain-containing protein n=1 Tax=Halostagnicola larsenii XH-48 TaxID=797299 RepID=W0JJH9_9EURY|nr:HalOD1 output domain-containing protein [Halostagnicola larsenii]AHF98768.1 hypothetical protein HALLA_07750 [Halostagnicola larsenii XH-48]
MPGNSPSDRLRKVGEATGQVVYYDDGQGTYHTWCDNDESEPVSTALLVTVSSVFGVEPEDLDALGECIDPDALNAIFVHWRGDEPRIGDGSVSFSFSRCDVTVRSDGEIIIDPHTRARDVLEQ